MGVTRSEQISFDKHLRLRLKPTAKSWYALSKYQVDLDWEDLIQDALVRFDRWLQRNVDTKDQERLLADKDFRRNAFRICCVCLRRSAVDRLRHLNIRPQATAIEFDAAPQSALIDRGTGSSSELYILRFLQDLRNRVRHPRASDTADALDDMFASATDKRFTANRLRNAAGLTRAELRHIADEIAALDMLQPRTAKDLDDEPV